MAKCSNCSAPLPENSTTCSYCGAANDIDLKGVHQYTTSKPNENRTCPHCDIPLNTINLNIDGNFYIERCSECMGMFFDPGELEAVLDKSVDNVYVINFDKLNPLNDATYRAYRDIKYIHCPICKQMMTRKNFSKFSGVIIDWCRNHGIWLDAGELKRLLEWRKAGGQLLAEKRMQEWKKREEERKKRLAQDVNAYNKHQMTFTSPRKNLIGKSSFVTESNILDFVSNLVFRLFG